MFLVGGSWAEQDYNQKRLSSTVYRIAPLIFLLYMKTDLLKKNVKIEKQFYNEFRRKQESQRRRANQNL